MFAFEEYNHNDVILEFRCSFPDMFRNCTNAALDWTVPFQNLAIDDNNTSEIALFISFLRFQI